LVGKTSEVLQTSEISANDWVLDVRRNLAGRRVLVTGASSGIGRALAEQLVRLGAKVGLAARSEDKLNEVARSLARIGEAEPMPADVTRDEDRRRLIETMSRRFGGLDVLVNNAGIASFAHFADSSGEILRQLMEVNFFAPAELIRLALPLLREGREAAIVNVSSLCGRRGLPAFSEYSASKFALCGLTEGLRAELALRGIDILLIVPGLVSTDLPGHMLRNTGRMKIDFTRGLAPEKVAAGIVRGLQRNKKETVLGSDARWLLRFNRFLPRLLDWLIVRRVRKLYA
jgi:short-subunit dehydrogenase